MFIKNENFFFENVDLEVLKKENKFYSQTFIDLILSNLIFDGKKYYLIDHEWLFKSSLPVNYVFIRGLHQTFYNKYFESKIKESNIDNENNQSLNLKFHVKKIQKIRINNS